MKVLHVINSLALGGAEKLISELLPEIVASGIDCAVFALDERGDAFSRAMAARGVPVAFARQGGANPYSPARLGDILAAIRRERPDIVHTHLGPSFHWCALTSLQTQGIVYVATEHASANRRMASPLLRPVERGLYARYAKIVCVSADTAVALRSWLGLGAERLEIIPNGIPLGRFADAKPAEDVAALLDGRFGVAMVARLVPVKNHLAALEVLASLPADYALVLVGEGPERPAIEARARALGIEGRCVLLGARDDVPEILAACESYLQTSKAEGFGIAALEAMAAGLPVVASEAPGHSALVAGAGALFPPGDAVACAAAIKWLRPDGAARESAIAAGRDRAEAFSIERCAGAYVRLYEEIRAAGTRGGRR